VTNRSLLFFGEQRTLRSHVSVGKFNCQGQGNLIVAGQETPISSFKTSRKHLLFANDRQIQYLSVKYRILPRDEKSEPAFGLRAAAYSDFLADCSQLQKIQSGEIEGCDDDTWQRMTEDCGRASLDDDPIDRLRELEREKNDWVTRFGQDVYDAWHELLMIDVQGHFLRTLAISPSQFVELLAAFACPFHHSP
jgi:hypothetical protein